ncbi:MAG: lysophospholipid acyltransferase family protein [Planctomycetaceae bacterium]
MSAERISQFAQYAVFRALVCVLNILPLTACIRFARFAAFVIWLLPRKLTRYHVSRENIRKSFGETLTDRQVDEMIHGMWVHLFRMIPEIVQLPRKLRLYNCADVIKFRNRDETVRCLSTGRPVLILSGHFGNWEVAMTTFGVFGFPCGVVARDLDNPYLDDWFRQFRRFTGHRLISKKGGGSEMAAILERRGHLGLLGDQDAGSGGLFVDFFGRPASTFKSIALLAIEFRAYILVGYARRLPDDLENNRWVTYELGTEEIIDPLEFDGPDAVVKITERYTNALERIVRLAPEQYFWVHRRWKSVPRQRGKKKRAAA